MESDSDEERKKKKRGVELRATRYLYPIGGAAVPGRQAADLGEQGGRPDLFNSEYID